jgi:thiamine biosynthesis protein ThiI
MTKVVCLLSGGIDSAAALGLALEQGMEAVAVHFQTSQDKRALEKAKKIAKHFDGTELIVVPFEGFLKEAAEKSERKYGCVLCKRMMQRVAGRIGKKLGASALLMGDSLGQVASQTLTNLNAGNGAGPLPVIRPLLGMDKLEIQKIAMRFGTMEKSSEPAACCPMPKKPSTMAKKAKIEALEKALQAEKLAEKILPDRFK